MSKTNTFNLISPFVSTRTTGKSAAVTSWGARKEVTARVANPAWVSWAALVGVIALGAMLALHLYWVNTYSDKGFALSEVQASIKVQTELQKKLLVQQSLLNSTAGLTEGTREGLIAITEEEYLAPNNFAAAQ